MNISTKYDGKAENWVLDEGTTVGQLKKNVAEKYNLVEDTVKLIGLTATRMPDSLTKLNELPKFKSKTQGTQPKPVVIMVLGTQAETISRIAEQDTAAEAIEAVEAAERAEWEAQERDYRMKQQESEHRLQLERGRIRHQQLLEQQRRLREEAIEAERRARRGAFSSVPKLELILNPSNNQRADTAGMAILPQSVLEKAMNMGVSMPLAFKCSLWTDIDKIKREQEQKEEEKSIRDTVESRYPHLFDDSITSAADLQAPLVPRFEIADGTTGSSSSSSSTSLSGQTITHLESDSNTSSSARSLSPSRRISYCGVTEFTAEEGDAILPSQLLEDLGYYELLASIAEAVTAIGDERLPAVQVHMETVPLEKGTAVTLQPLTPQWEFIPETQRAALLEHYLRQHVLLARCSTFSVKHNGRTYKFYVRDTTPGPVIGLSDSELATDIYPYDEHFVPQMFDSTERVSESSGSGEVKMNEEVQTSMPFGSHQTPSVYRPAVMLAPSFPPLQGEKQGTTELDEPANPNPPLSLQRAHSDVLPVATLLSIRPHEESDAMTMGVASPKTPNIAIVEASFTKPGEATYVAIPIHDARNVFYLSLKHTPRKTTPTSAFISGNTLGGEVKTAAAGAASSAKMSFSSVPSSSPHGSTSAPSDSGDVDVYCAFHERHPGPDAFDVCSQTIGDKEMILDYSISPDFVTGGHIFIAFQNYGGECKFTATVRVEKASSSNGDKSKSKGQKLLNDEVNDEKSSDSKYNKDEDLEADLVTCDTCRQRIPSSSLRLHTASCRRRFQACPYCNQVFPKTGTQFGKHVAQMHESTFSCRCGQFVGTQNEIAEHRSTSCSLKPLQCKYCPLKFETRNLVQHQNECSLRQSQCRLCNETLVRGRMRYHISTNHGVSLDDITVDMWY